MQDGQCSNPACKKHVGIHVPSSVFYIEANGGLHPVMIDPVRSSWRDGFKTGGGGILGKVRGCCGQACFEIVSKNGHGTEQAPTPRNRIIALARRKPMQSKAAV